ncbi:MAG: TRAP transporter substrate-binding protein [Treponemataceae bacterium]|nr:TRAP transporter substrate-binding protein [Treponemataceae bacterium]
MAKRLAVAALALCVVCAGCNKTQNVTARPKTDDAGSGSTLVTITLGFSTNKEDPRGVASLLFKEEVEQNSNGRITVDIHADGTLGSDADLIDGVVNDTLDMTISSAGNFAVYAPEVGISALPFLFSDFESAWQFMDSPLVQDVDKTLEAFNIVVLSHFDNGFRCVTTTDRAVNCVADMKGLHIRTPPNQIVMETMAALGANPEPYAFNELKKALKDGLFDSQENPIPIIYNSRLYEEQHCLAITNHSYDAMPLVIRKSLWDTLGEGDRRILREAAKKAQDLNRQLVRNQTDAFVSRLHNVGMTITNPNLHEFALATTRVMDTFSAVYGKELIHEMKELTQ